MSAPDQAPLLNPNDAPAGFRAVQIPVCLDSCRSCAFLAEGSYPPCGQVSCLHDVRADGCEVVFHAIEEGAQS